MIFGSSCEARANLYDWNMTSFIGLGDPSCRAYCIAAQALHFYSVWRSVLYSVLMRIALRIVKSIAKSIIVWRSVAPLHPPRSLLIPTNH